MSQNRGESISSRDGEGSSRYAIRTEGITKRFPGVVANDDVDFEVERGTIHALVGENGAGKTTLMNMIYGLYEPTEGQLYVDSVPREFDSPREAIDAGIGMIHQHFMLVDPMTVAENLVLGEEPRKWFGLAADEGAAIEHTRELADRYDFDIDPTERIEEISVGEQQRVEILKALYRGAETLILDEPTAVLTPQEVDRLFEVFEELIAEDKTIIFITHKLGEALAVADRISVLRDGELVGTVDGDRATREELATMMVGREVLFDVSPSAAEQGETTLAVEELTVDDDRDVRAVDDVSFGIRTGEIFGIAGVDGNGQSELVETITGLRSAESGTVVMDGIDVTDRSRRARIASGMAYIAEDRHERSLVLEYDLTRNALLGTQKLPGFSDGRIIDWGHVDAYTERVINEYDVRPADPDATAASLSGGNQQKFIVGREFEREPSVLVASHPTRGVDIGSIEFIHDRLLDLRANGVAVLLVSSKLEEVKRLSDRMAVVNEGEFMDVVDPETVSEAEVGLLMAGEYPDGYEPTVQRSELTGTEPTPTEQ